MSYYTNDTIDPSFLLRSIIWHHVWVSFALCHQSLLELSLKSKVVHLQNIIHPAQQASK